MVAQVVRRAAIDRNRRGGREGQRPVAHVGQCNLHQFHGVAACGHKTQRLGAQAHLTVLPRDLVPQQPGLQRHRLGRIGREPLRMLRRRVAGCRPRAVACDMHPEVARRTGVVQVFGGDRQRQKGVLTGLGVAVQRRRHRRHHAGLVDQREVEIAGLMRRCQTERAVVAGEVPCVHGSPYSSHNSIRRIVPSRTMAAYGAPITGPDRFRGWPIGRCNVAAATSGQPALDGRR